MTLARDISIEAFKQAIADKTITGRQADVLRLIINGGPGTSAELVSGTALARNLNLTRARFTELARAGTIRTIESRKCKITGRRAQVWDLGDGIAPAPRLSHFQTLAECKGTIDALEKALGEALAEMGGRRAANWGVINGAQLKATQTKQLLDARMTHG